MTKDHNDTQHLPEPDAEAPRPYQEENETLSHGLVTAVDL